MGLWDSNVPNGEGDGDRVSETGPTCSICFDAVTTGGGGRSTAKLKCGHEFHLDCIGSAFNAKGMMQCPNCRNIEKGNWLNGNGFCLLPAINIDEWTYGDDIYDLNYLEMPYGVHWCPVNRIGTVTSSFVPHSLPLLPDLSSNRTRNIPGEHSTSYSDLRQTGNIRNHLPFPGPTTWPSSPVLPGFYIYPPPVTIYSSTAGDMMNARDQFQTSQGVQFIPAGSAESGRQSVFWLRHPSEMISAPAMTVTWPNGSVRVRPI